MNMPRGSRRSVGYRFITCGDPDEDVECGSIRRSRAKYQMMESVVENPRKMMVSTVRPPRKDWEGENGQRVGVDGVSAAVQLSEVSRGAQELNRMIETWSRGESCDGQSKDIAKDLLKGAINLQESLILLGRLQEATKYVARLKQKGEQSEDARKDVGFQKPRISADDALGRTYKFRRKEYNSFCDVPSTSSSQSSTLNGDDDAAYVAESGAFTTAIAQQGSTGRSNVIAKLMGLEEIPSKKRMYDRKNPQRKKTASEMDVDKFSKPRLEVPKLGRGPGSLKEILEGMRSKGLLGSNSVGNRNCGNDGHPPIVLIKPFAAPAEKANEQLSQHERILRTEVLINNAKLKEEIFRRFSDSRGKVYRSARLDARNKAEEYDSFGRRGKVPDRTKEGRHSKKQLSTQVSEKPPKSNAVDQKHGKVQNDGKNHGRYSEEASRSRMPFPDPRRPDYAEPTIAKLRSPKSSEPKKLHNETTTSPFEPQKNSPNRRISDGRRTKPSDHDRSLKVKRITITTEKDIRQDKISTAEWQKIENADNVSRRMEADPVTMEASSSSTVTSASLEAIDLAAAVIQPQEDFNHKQSDVESEDCHTILLCGGQSPAFTRSREGKALLWSDSAFLTRLEDLFEDFGIHPMIHESFEKREPRPEHDKLYLDCANEFIERKSLDLHSVFFTSRGICPSLTSTDKLIQEVCSGIDDLNGWCELADGHLSADGFHALLKRDMWSKGFASGTWELGWNDGLSRDDIERVVSDAEKMVLAWLIEEAIADV